MGVQDQFIFQSYLHPAVKRTFCDSKVLNKTDDTREIYLLEDDSHWRIRRRVIFIADSSVEKSLGSKFRRVAYSVNRVEIVQQEKKKHCTSIQVFSIVWQRALGH